jgi:hypothetical protein
MEGLAGGWFGRIRWGNGLFGWRQRKESARVVSEAVGWRRGRLLLVHGSENQKQGGQLCFFSFQREGATRRGR